MHSDDITRRSFFNRTHTYALGGLVGIGALQGLVPTRAWAPNTVGLPPYLGLAAPAVRGRLSAVVAAMPATAACRKVLRLMSRAKNWL